MGYFRPRVLLVDDDADNRELMPILLEMDGDKYDIVSCRSCAEAEERLAAEKFDLVILDYMMPGTNGADFCRALREKDSSIPVMFYTAMGVPFAKKECIEAGADIFLIKPNDMDRICPAVKELVEHRPKIPPRRSNRNGEVFGSIF